MRNLLLCVIFVCFVGILPAAAQSNPLYVASPETNTVLVVDPDSETVIAVIEVGTAPTTVTIDPETGHVLVTNSGDDTVSVIDIATNEVIETIEMAAATGRLMVETENSLDRAGHVDPHNPVIIEGGNRAIAAIANINTMNMGRFGRFVQLLLPTYPLCPLNPEATRATFQTNLTPGLIDIHCRILAEHGEFVQPPAEIGVQAVLDLGVIHAVELFSPSDASMERIDVCLRGIGTIFFLDVEDQPRKPKLLQGTVRSGYTCAQLPGPGTIILTA